MLRTLGYGFHREVVTDQLAEEADDDDEIIPPEPPPAADFMANPAKRRACAFARHPLKA